MKADTTYVDSVASTKADASAVYTKAQTESKIVELAPATDISMKANTTYVDTQINSATSTKADASAVYTKAQVEAKIVELSPPANWNTLANKPQDIVLFSYTEDYHPSNLSAGTLIRNWTRINGPGGNCCYTTYSDKMSAGSAFSIGSGNTANFRVKFRGYRQEGTLDASIYKGNTRLAHHSWGNGCCWQTLGESGWLNFSVQPGASTLTPWLGANIRGVNHWVEYKIEFLSWS